MKHLFYSCLFALFLPSCGGDPEPRSINANAVIISAEILTYEQVSDSIKETIRKYGCYCHPTNWNELRQVDTTTAYFIKAEIDNGLLAEISESETFSKDLLMEMKYSLYGKYHNRWKCLNSGGQPICENDKFGGFDMVELNRQGDKDKIIIGPMRERPAKLIIEISNSKNYPNATPEYSFK